MKSEIEPTRSALLGGARFPHRSRFCVGAVSVQLGGDQEADVTLVPPLEPFRVETGLSDINIRVERVSRLSPVSGQRLFDSGTTWELSQGDAEFQFDFHAAIFGDRPLKRLLIDTGFCRGTLQMNEECLARFPNAVAPLGYPLDELLIMHRLTQERAIELHSCGIVRPDGTGDLFVGHSGAGKSTTTRLWTEREDVEVLSDDRIIVRQDEDRPGVDKSGVETRCMATDARGREGILRLRDRSASPTGHCAQDDRLRTHHFGQDDKPKKTCGMRMYGTPWHGEAMYASPNSAPLSRIFILEHGHGNVVTRLSPSQAVGELFARSFVPFHRHEYVDSALDFLQELVGSVPCYHFAFEPDQRAVETILNFPD
jgi:hypothetical protein